MAEGGIEVAQEAHGDPRFAHLAKLCGLADAAHAVGRMTILWHACKRREQHVLPESLIDEVLGAGGSDHLIEAHLGERVLTGGVRLKGSADRIRWRRKSDAPGMATNGQRRANAWTDEEKVIAARVLGKLVERSGFKYRTDAPTNIQPIVRLLREGFLERDLQRVVWHRCAEWRGDEKMETYLRPATLFGQTNFEGYLPQADAAIETAKRDKEASERPLEVGSFLKESNDG